MNIKTFRTMLECRNYQDFYFTVNKEKVECKIENEHIVKVIDFNIQEWEFLTVAQARDYLDETIGEGMVHVMHVCGQCLLQAEEGWNANYEDEDPYHDCTAGYYSVPVDENATPVCGYLP